MKNLGDFLNKYRRLIKDEGSLKRSILEVVAGVCGESLGEKNITVKDRSIFIKCSPALRSQLFMSQELLLKTINEKTKLSFKEIRF